MFEKLFPVQGVNKLLPRNDSGTRSGGPEADALVTGKTLLEGGGEGREAGLSYSANAVAAA